MKCPVDSTLLTMSERNGVEIDYCPVCRGVWLDRGELDKILDRAAAETGPVRPAATQQTYVDPRYGDQLRGDQLRGDQRQAQQPYGQAPYYKKRKDSWLSELFD
ncbi:zf-TFIIB domain-containing protein [Salinibacterium hongtaonis]|uniref:Transcription factor zinc-finger domain-containing protein n=1 Tax=Homoserinimonas hongtaonis TaxID=2079791 RepID=A0A2U1T343_9MICO|nr:zf-TFIIB domain-containing protein [Salinibacterium hongtaonis]AWB88504.1 hypothetical protein C2138_02120 [Salinibacterium hongtaonis]PWB98286.1 hypothetical protein DF220_10930 [Salinibacterium hongtaonis]